jgi:RNA polymerase primary sigma factor
MIHSHPIASQDTAFAAYMRDVGRHALLKPEEERTLAHELVALRANLWRQILSYAPYTAAIIERVAEEGDFVEHAEVFARLCTAARGIRDSNKKAAADAFQRAVERTASILAFADPESILADRILADLELLSTRADATGGLAVRPPRRGSKPFSDYLGSIRRASAAMRCVRNQFARANLRLVVKIASRFQRSGLTLHDRVQEGNLGLMKAIDRFDPTKGFRFSTYASWWIKHAIRRAVVNRDRTIRLPAHLQATAQRISASRSRLRQKGEHEPSARDIAEDMDLPLDKVELTLEAMTLRPISLDAPLGAGDDRSVADTLFDEDAPGPAERIALDHDAHRVRGSLLELEPMERDILRQRFGLDGAEPRTLTEIGQQYSLSRERIRQLQQQALRRLRGRLEDVVR